MDLYDAFDLGGDIEYLKQVERIEPTVKERKAARELTLLGVLRRIMKELVRNSIDDELQDTIYRWTTKLEREYRAGQKLKGADAKELSDDADRLEDLLYRQLLDRPIVEFSRKGALNQKALVGTSRGYSSALFEQEIWRDLPSIAKSDFSDAAKCLLIEASTPAAMVALRGMEAVVREYYKVKKGRESGKKALGPIIKELRNLPDANAKLLEHIDYLRSEKRNLAQHPDKTFDQREAERIFMEIISTVHDIRSDMPA